MKTNAIELKNINLDGVTVIEELEKLREEQKELRKAVILKNRENIKEEFWDVMQSWMGFLQLKFNITAEELMEYYPKHLEKIKDRPRVKNNEV